MVPEERNFLSEPVIKSGIALLTGDLLMTSGTGASNPEYNLVSVLYHALQGAELYQTYANDAGSDQDLANYFREVQQQEQQRAERAKQLLATRLQRS